MNLANQSLNKTTQNKLWHNALESFNPDKSVNQLLKNNQQLCEKVSKLAENKMLVRKTGSYRTMYRLEYLMFWYFENKIEQTQSLKSKNYLKKQMRHIIKVINQELDNKEVQNKYDTESDSENQISSNSEYEPKDDETYSYSGSDSDYDSEEESFEQFKNEVYNMKDSELNESLELRYLYTKGTRQQKIDALLDFGPMLPTNLTNTEIERILNKYKVNYQSDSDSDSDYEPDDEKNKSDSDCDSHYQSDDEKNHKSDSDSDSDYEPYNHKKNNKVNSDYLSDSDSDSDYEPYNHKKQ
tara:strand:+ start:248 stop:1138 length:891 start_codon:yes stop_codon:yes gene_type:complete